MALGGQAAAIPADGGAGRWRLNAGSLAWAVLALVLVALVANPVLRIFQMSLEGPNNTLTLANFAEAFSRIRYIVAYRNSLILGVCVAALCLVFALPMAWGVARTNMPGKKLVQLLVLATFVTPPFLGATAWVLLAGPNAGWLNQAFKLASGSEDGFLNIYSFAGIVFVIAIYSFPYLFVFTSGALNLVSSEMEDAANILGASQMRATLTVTLPLIAPAIVAGMIITFLEAIAIIGSTVLIALPARINLIPLQLWEFFGYPIKVEVAAAYAVPMLLVTVGLFALQYRILRGKGYVALTGKGGERREIDLGAWRWPLLGYCLFILTLSIVLPYGVLTQAAFAKAWTRGIGAANLTFDNFHYLLVVHSLAKQSILNTFTYASATATIAVALALCVAYSVQRRLVPFAGILGFLAFVPFVIPGLILAIGFYAAYAPPPFALAGTATILILAFVTRFLPIAYANAAAAVKGIHPEMEDAVRILGGSRLTAVRRVVAPLLKRNLLGAWLLVFIPVTREVSSALFLYGPKTRTMSVLFFDLTEGGNFEQLAALGLILLATTLVFVFVGQFLIGSDFMVRRSTS